MAFNWTCPFCGYPQAVTNARHDVNSGQIRNNDSIHKRVGFRVQTIVCSNPECREMELTFAVGRRTDYTENGYDGTPIWYSMLHPESSAKPQPDYFPQPIVNDYNQACRIRDLSPNASATMARRCLQGMLRDFCGITKGTLAQEIDVLRELADSGKAPLGVDPSTVDAIDHVRSIGNIGAHMEKDINLILDVDPDEAQTLINLIEVLFKEWYVARETRNERLKQVGLVVESKKQIKEAAKEAPAPSSDTEKATGEQNPETKPTDKS